MRLISWKLMGISTFSMAVILKASKFSANPLIGERLDAPFIYLSAGAI